MQFDFITASIVLLPAAYATLVAVQFISGLVTLWSSQRPAPAPQMPSAVSPAPAEVTPVAPAAQPDQGAPAAPAFCSEECAPAPLPAFIPNPAPTIYSTDDHALVEAAAGAIAQYWQQQPTDNVVKFQRPAPATQKAQQQHPALEGKTVHQLRRMALDAGMKGAARWNRQQCLDRLAAHYLTAAA